MPLVPSRRIPSRFSGSMVAKFAKGAAGALAHALVGEQPVRSLERLLAFAFGERDDAPGRAPPGADSWRPLLLVDQHQLGRAAADIEDQRRAVAGLEELVAAKDGKPRLFRRLDDVERDAGLVADALGEIAPLVARRQASVATERESETLRRPQLVGADRKRADGAVHRVLGESAGPRRPSPRRTMRENASMTVNPPSVGRAIRSRQLFVPRSIAP